RAGGAGFRVRRFPRGFRRRAGEGVAEAMDRPDVPRVLSVLADRLADLGDQARQRRLRHERVRPYLLVDLGLGEGAGTRFEQQLQQPESLGREVDGPLAPEDLPGLAVEGAVTEKDAHAHSPENPRKSQDDSQDSPAGKKEARDVERRTSWLLGSRTREASERRSRSRASRCWRRARCRRSATGTIPAGAGKPCARAWCARWTSSPRTTGTRTGRRARSLSSRTPRTRPIRRSCPFLFFLPMV